MQRMYYLFSSANLCEAISVCDDGDSIDTPRFQTGVYPMGTLLSKAVQLIKPWISDPASSIKREVILNQEFNKSFPGRNPNNSQPDDNPDSAFDPNSDSSFPGIVNYDPNVRRSMELLLQDRWNLIPRREERNIEKLLKKYMEYIHECQSDRNKNNIKHLNIIVSQQKDTMPEQSFYFPIPETGQDSSNEDKTSEWIQALTGTPFISAVKKNPHKHLLPTLVSEPELIITKWEPLTLPLDVFELHDIVDLLLASLACVFENQYFLKECCYCKNLFITRKRNKKYCPVQDSENNKTCYDKMNLKLQLARESSGRRKVEKSLRTMYANRYGTSSKKYLIFLNHCQKWRDIIRAGKATEERYLKWLNKHYIRKNKHPVV